MAKKQRRRYDAEFKREAVQLALNDRSIEVASDFSTFDFPTRKIRL